MSVPSVRVERWIPEQHSASAVLRRQFVTIPPIELRSFENNYGNEGLPILISGLMQSKNCFFCDF